ncbi:MAG TPA: cohesin domain-containing protein [Kineosporiaceae bacterium]|nr:cohesin domain-containing protein [Kineosporiaceae bacterium]
MANRIQEAGGQIQLGRRQLTTTVTPTVATTRRSKMFMGSARSESMGETHMFRRLVGLAAAGVVAAGVGTAVPASAAQASMQLSPATTTVAKGGDVALTVKVNTGGQAVNAIQFYINLPSRLHCSSITPVTTGWPNSFAPPNSCTDTLAAFVVYSNGGTSFNGTAPIATIHLKATQVAGQAIVAFDPTKSLVATATGQDAHATTTSRSVVTVK